MGIVKNDKLHAANAMYAATASDLFAIPVSNDGTVMLPQDLSLDLAKKGLSASEQTTEDANVATIDSLNRRISELERTRQVTKVKWKKAPAPPPVAPDTIRVPVYYLATQVGNKESPTGECISIYEVHKVDEICTGTTISSEGDINEYHVKDSD